MDLAATNTDRYRRARDLLVAGRSDAFTWPEITGAFNWAIDWFDVIARDNARTALWIVEEDGREQQLSFAEMSRRSDQVATWLRVGRHQG